MITLYVLIGFLLLSFVIGFFRKIKIQEKVQDIYKDVEEDNDFYIDLLSKIIEDDSFKIMKEIKDDNSNLQVITFDWKVFNINDELPGTLSKNNLKKIIKIIFFMINDNHQWPLIRNKKEFYIPIEADDGKIGIGSIKSEDLKEYLNDIEIETFSILNNE